MSLAIELLNITKRYPGVVANNDVSIRIEKGEIHGLIGENGAGKSTIMNILYGLTKPDEGVIKLFGKEQLIESPQDAIKLGIGMVHQHFMLMPNQTVMMNIILGAAPRKGIFVNKAAARKAITEIMETYGLWIDLDAKISRISVGEKQKVEILKALYRKVEILILDEPTAVLTPAETDGFLGILQKLKAQGCTIVFITHKLKEVLSATDRVTVMRKGVVTGEGNTQDMNVRKLSELIVGREVLFQVPMKEYSPGPNVLELESVTTTGRMPLNNVSLTIRQGEIVGIAGVEGNGQSELVEAIVGMTNIARGSITLNGTKIEKENIRKRRQLGISHIPEDRLKTGASKPCTISENLLLNRYFQEPYSKFGIFRKEKVAEFSENLCKDFQVKTPDSSYLISTLSGGNIQKVVFAREFEASPELLIAAQPTRGVDIGAIEYIYSKIVELRDSPKGILLVSAELDEIMTLSDRILIMYEGEIVAEFKRGEADEYEIGEYMLGAKKQEGRN